MQTLTQSDYRGRWWTILPAVSNRPESSVERPEDGLALRSQSERDWHSSADAANIRDCCERGAPNNCRLVVDVRSIHRD